MGDQAQEPEIFVRLAFAGRMPNSAPIRGMVGRHSLGGFNYSKEHRGDHVSEWLPWKEVEPKMRDMSRQSAFEMKFIREIKVETHQSERESTLTASLDEAQTRIAELETKLATLQEEHDKALEQITSPPPKGKK